MKSIFLEKSFAKCGGETSPRSFSKKIKIEHNSDSTVSNFIQFAFILCLSQGLPKYTETLHCKNNPAQ